MQTTSDGNKKMDFKTKIINELHAAARRNFTRRNTTLKGIDDLHQCDLVEMGSFSKLNKGYKYILTIINCFSKKAQAYALKSKTGKEVTSAMKKYLANKNNVVKNLQTDMGKEFYNTSFQNLMSSYNVNHYSTFSELKATIVERFNRTLKNAMYKRFSLRGTYKWIDILPELINNYNNTKHRTIGMKPKNVNKSNEHIVKTRIIKSTLPKPEKKPPHQFLLGDNVRISKIKSVFDKRYFPNWTNEVFTIYRVHPSNPETYILKDKSGKILHGTFYGHELLKSNTDNVYLIDKVLRKKGNKLLVKWLGFDRSQSTWINKKDIL